MKFKQELVSLVTVTFKDWSEYELFEQWFNKSDVMYYDRNHISTSDNIGLHIVVKLHDAPKIQRFVRKFKTKTLP